ncbi:hypothetical protein DPMN_077636 [Dreissena polymorpha]|uniref:Cytochrome c oxidase assembly factor 3 n=1 Tax=Dreissena polymorpha TaxID=45954 RepID=A0A9D3YL68_DREPO|nr:hypothetical protein DPMN_077591 [Dreissena polymorpha]KAH3702612.1 hypothetical protein DPMN_077636 [Dreissena polymorpha]
MSRREISPADLERLDDIQKMYMKRFEQKNNQRVSKYVHTRWKNRITGGLLGCLVIGVYAYTIRALRQEKMGPEYDQRFSDVAKKESSST